MITSSPKKQKSTKNKKPMKFQDDQIEQEIYNALMSRRTNFEAGGMEFTKEKEIKGTKKERQRKCRARAKELVKILNS